MKRHLSVGDVHGRLTIVETFLRLRNGAPGRGSRLFVVAKCECGKTVTVNSTNFGRRTFSCGCLMRERASEANITHGMARTREHTIWLGIRARCLNPAHEAFPSYGGRGITVCATWRESFEAFFRDMGPCPDGLSIDRIDNNGQYSPENCRWATKKDQANNRRSNRIISFNGRSLTLTEWADVTGLPYDTLKQRFTKLGWSPDRALTTAVRSRKAA